MDEMIARGWDQLIGRLTGPMAFRFVMQPVMAALLAVRAGLADARSGQPAYLWSIFARRADRGLLIRRGWHDVAKVFMMASVLDAAYQVYMFQFFYPVQTFIVAVLLAIVPYIFVRGPVARLARLASPARGRERVSGRVLQRR